MSKHMGIDGRIMGYLLEEIRKDNLAVHDVFRQNTTMSYIELKDYLNSKKTNIQDSLSDTSRAALRLINKKDLQPLDYDWMRRINKLVESIKNSDSARKEEELKSLGVSLTKESK